MEIKIELDTEKELKAAVAIAAAYGLCRVSTDTKYPQLATANAIALIVIIAILYGPHPTLKSTKIPLNTITHGGSLLHGTSHYEATGP